MGQLPAPVPSDLSNVKAIAAGPTYTLALKSDGTVAAWGQGSPTRSNDGDLSSECLNVPAGLNNVVAITVTATDPAPADRAAGFAYAVAWGDGSPATYVPATAG